MADEHKKPEVKDSSKVDFEPILAEQIPICVEMSKNGKLSEAVTKLLVLEKKTRLASEFEATAEVALTIVKMCFDLKDWSALNSNVVLISKRRAQHRNVISKVVKEVSGYLEHTPNTDTKIELIKSLRTVTTGKIYAELEYSRLTKILAEIKEAAGDVEAAAKIIQEVTVETCGSMEKHEKTEFILEQIRLVLDRSDYVRTNMILRKIDTKLLEADDMQELKLKYYALMLRLHTHEQNTFALAKDHYAIFCTPSVTGNEKAAALAQVCVYLVLSAAGPEQADLLRLVQRDQAKPLDNVPAYKSLLTLFTTREIMPWPLPMAAELNCHPAFTDSATAPPVSAEDTLLMLDDDAAQGKEQSQGQRWMATLRNRVVEHNVSVVAEYYRRITTARLANLLGLQEQAVEKYVSSMVWSAGLQAKIDRPKGIICFRPAESASSQLSGWADQVGQLLRLVDDTCHLVNKENMVHKLA